MAQEQVKISQLDTQPTPTTSDKVPVVSGGVTKNETLASLITLFFNNIPAGTIPGSIFDYVISGGVWSGDAYGSTRNASMTAMSVYINNRTIAVNAVVARSFTASRDTYVDLLDNLDGTGTLVYTEVTNNAASPALASNSIRIAIIVTGASNIASVASINQGQEDKVLPIASSIPYTVTDSIGNLICPRDPQRKLLAYRQATSSFNTSGESDIAPLNLNFFPVANRKVKITAFIGDITASVANNGGYVLIYDVTAAGNLAAAKNPTNASGDTASVEASVIKTFATGARNIKARLGRGTNAATTTGNASATNPAYLKVELM